LKDIECNDVDELLEMLNESMGHLTHLEKAIYILAKEFKTLEADYMALENYCSDLETEFESVRKALTFHLNTHR
jgi:hypothetical protein